MAVTVRLALIFLPLLLLARPAAAQNWSFDAREIALGGIGGTDNLATKMIDDVEPYGNVVLPFGLLQGIANASRLSPANDEFDIVRAIEFAIAPIHYVIGRNGGTATSGQDFFVDLINGALNRDLNAYRGFVPANQPTSGGLAAPSIGATIPVFRDSRGGFQGLYVGVGPYVSLRGSLTTDPELTSILASTGDKVYVQNGHMDVAGGAQTQAAVSLTLGYRGRVPFPWTAAGSRDGLYVALDYHYLRGLRYDDFDSSLRLDTDGNGLLTLNPFLPTPLAISRRTATAGSGKAVDVGVGAAIGPWEVGGGINGIRNGITWSNTERRLYSLGNLLNGSDLVESSTQVVGAMLVTVPLDYRANLAYHMQRTSFVGAVGTGFNGAWTHGGVERRLSHGALRVGGFYTRGNWRPSGGVGINLAPGVALDIAAYGSTANIERKTQTTVAVSLRFSKQPQQRLERSAPATVLPPVSRPREER